MKILSFSGRTGRAHGRRGAALLLSLMILLVLVAIVACFYTRSQAVALFPALVTAYATHRTDTEAHDLVPDSRDVPTTAS